ncbi:MAG: NAD(P)-dependent oxidoreductase, partial [Chitinophagaceae bacterium]
MKLLIFGANGTIGTQLLLQALARGHKVRAFVRNPEKISGIQHLNLELYTGDVFQIDEIAGSMEGIDAVLCVHGDGRVG